MPDLSAEVEPTGSDVSSWVTDNIPPLASLLDSSVEMQSGIQTYRFIVQPDREAAVANTLAIGIVAHRLRQRPRAFRGWHSALNCGSLPAEDAALVRRFIATALGEPSEPRPLTHLYGFVAEHALAELLQSVDRGLGHPVHLEQHDWSVTDPGGDCVAVYEVNEDLHFRLWESKAITGATVDPGTTVGGAVAQLDLRAWEYLARWSAVAQHMNDQELARFFVQMPDLWSNGDVRAGAGVGVATHATKSTDACFTGLVGQFNLPESNKHGSLILSADFAALALSVRSLIWKGAGWSEH